VLSHAAPAHRLDADTGGLLLCAKTQGALAALCTALAERRIKKRYRALVLGRLEGCGRITFRLDDKACWTEYRAVSHSAAPSLGGDCTTVDLWPHTGRCVKVGG